MDRALESSAKSFRGASRSTGLRVELTIAFLLYAGIAIAGRASDRVGSPHTRISAADRVRVETTDLPGPLGRKLELALGLARLHVRTLEECSGLFEPLEQSGEATLARGRFRSAPGRFELRVCRDGTSAFTRIGGEVTYLCRSFARLAPARAATVLIHEALHQAGLPESPAEPEAMRSREINELVTRSCRL